MMPFPRLKPFLATLLFLLSFLPLYGYHFRHLTINDGLSNNAVYSIFQDSKGFMWFGTIDGIHCYDGKHLRVVRPENPEVYIGNLIYSIAEDDRQRLWIGTDNGLALYSLKEEKYIPFNHPAGKLKTFESRILHLFLDSRKCMWIATSSEGLYCLDMQTERMKHFSTPELNSNSVRNIMEDKKGRIWITLVDRGVVCYEVEANRFTNYSDPGVNSGLLTFEDSNTNIWVGTSGNGLFQIDPESHKITQKIAPLSKHSMLQIRSILEPKIGELLLASDEGLITYNIKTNSYGVIKANPTQFGQLNDNYLHALFIDQENGIWVGSYFGGVNYISPTSNNFSSFSCYNSPFKGKVISAFAKDEKENLWIGTDDSGFFYWNRTSNTFKEFYPSQGGKNSPTYQNVHALLPDGDKLYIGMYMGGLDILDIKTNQIKNHNVNKSERSLYSSGVYALYKDPYGKIWVGTSAGLNSYNPKTDDFDRISEVSKVDVTSIQEDQRGFLWVTTLGSGIFRLNRKTNKWENFKFEKDKKNSIAVNKVTTLSLDQHNNLWFGTDGGGICRFDYDKNEFINHTTSEFPSEVIYKIIPDNDYLWISSSKGLIKFHPEQKTLRVFNKYDGLQDNQFSPNAGVKMNDGTVYFGGINGYNGFKPSEIMQNSQVPTVVLTNFRLFNKPVGVNEGNSPLKTSITYTDRLVLGKKHAIFSLEFAALSYTGAHKNRYKYMLEGFETEWTEASNEPSVTYTNLPAGQYTFRVKASNGDGIWNEAGIALPIKILPPIWLSYPFLTGYFAILLSLLFLYLRRLKRRHRNEIANISIEKEKEIYSTKLNFFSHIVHEIRTPLTLILGPLKHIMSSDGEIKDVMPQLQLIERNGSRLLSLVNQLMDFRKIEDGGMTVIPKPTCVNQQLEDLHSRFKLSAELKGVALHLNVPAKTYYALLDDDAFSKIVSNLLSNALKFTKNTISISLIPSDESQTIDIEIKDNGWGIDENEQENIFKPFYQIKENRPSDYIGTGIGLLLVKKLVEMLQGEIFLKSVKGEGASFTVRFQMIPSPQQIDDTSKTESESTTLHESLPVAQSKPSLLLVDDNRDLLSFLENLLSKDYQTLTCLDGNEALLILKSKTIDLVISDVMMPNMDGLELCSAIKRNILTSHIPVLLLTAKVGMEDRIQGLENGADVYVEKPFSAEVLKAQIVSLLTNRNRVRRSFKDDSSIPLTSIANTKVDEQFLGKIHQYIEDNISDTQLSVEMIAKEVGMGRSNFFTKVKSLSAMTPNDLIRVIRLNKAKSYFDAGDSSISDVCFRVGFSAPSYFSKCFQQQFGQTPSEYVKNKKERSRHA